MTNLSLKQIQHHYNGADVLKQVSIDIAAGEVVCLLGPSGCGKSTLLRIAAGIEPLQQGRVCLAGQDVSQVPTERRNIGLVLQQPSLFGHMTVLENVMFANPNRQVALDQLALGRMEDYAGHYPHMLSGGQQQRVALARALARKPQVMLLDEPFANLDDSLRQDVREQSVALLKAANIPTLFVTHDPHEALSMADRIVVMQAGIVVQQGSPQALYASPLNIGVARIFGELNCMDATAKNGVVASPWGDVAADGVADGLAVQLCIRPEAVQLAEKGGVRAVVEGVRFFGLSSIIYLRLADSDVVLHARRYGAHAYQPGDEVSVVVDDALVFEK